MVPFLYMVFFVIYGAYRNWVETYHVAMFLHKNVRTLYEIILVYVVALIKTFPCKIVRIHVGYRGLAANVM